MKRICYVHGFGSTMNGETAKLFEKIGQELGYETYLAEYDPKHPIYSMSLLNSFFEEFDIDIIVGASLGGFMTLYSTNRFKLLINPCMKPSIELPKIGYEGPTDEYEDLESTYSNFDIEDSVVTRVLLGTDDELLGRRYEKMIKTKFAQTSLIKSTHRPDERVWRNVIFPEIESYFNDIHKLVKQL